MPGGHSTQYGGGAGGGAADFKNARLVASVAPLPAYTRVGNVITENAPGALPNIDGLALAVGNSFLFINGASAVDNGLYDVTSLGSGITPFVLTRSADADTSPEVTSGMQVPILQGTYAGQTFYLATPDPIVLNTTPLIFALMTAASLWKNARVTATDTALPAYTRVANTITSNAPGALPTIGGVALTVGQSFVLQNGASDVDNGLWTVADLGSGGTPFVLNRSPDASSSTSMASGIRVPITDGVFAGQILYLSTPGSIILNTTGLTFSLDYASSEVSARTATSVALPAYTRVGNVITENAPGALPSISNVALAVGENLLLQTGQAAADNGLWMVTDLGSGGTPFQMVRAPGANTSELMRSGLRIPVTEGLFAGQTLYLSTQGAVTLNVTGLTFSSADVVASTPMARTVTNSALPAYTRVGNTITENAPGALPSISGVALAAGDSFLLRNGAAAADNGLWTVSDLGSGGTAFVLTRSPVANTSAQVASGQRVSITEGTFAGQTYYLSTANPITLNATGLTYTLDSGVPTGVFRALPIARGAYVARSANPIPGVAVTPGWVVIAEFDLDVAPTAGAVLDGIVLVTQGALTGRLKLYDITAAGDVAGSTLSTSSLTGARLTSGDLTAVLTVAHRYQIQAECTGGAAASDWATVRYAGVFPL